MNMIEAELKGKIPSNFEHKEDVLTSNVFSFFKYSERTFFRDYLNKLGIEVSQEDTVNAEFLFWPSYNDGTEPDLVIICGNYYLLFEAKLYSDFAQKTLKNDAQIDREINKGRESAKNQKKEFVYIALTAEYYKDAAKYKKYESPEYRFIWTNWQFIAKLIFEKFENEDIKNDFAHDLLLLLIKKGLRGYYGVNNITFHKICLSENPIFYNNKLSDYFKSLYYSNNQILNIHDKGVFYYG